MTTGKYSHYKGEKSPNWRGGKPRCLDCGVVLANYSSKRCRKCNSKIHLGKNHPLYGKHHLEETKEKIKLSKLKNPIRYWLGKRHTCTFKTKICMLCKKEFVPRSGKSFYCLNCKNIKKNEWRQKSKFHHRYANSKLLEPIQITQPKSLERPLKRVLQTRESNRKWRHNHPEEHRRRNAEWRRNNKDKVNFMNRRREYVIRGASGFLTWTEWQEIKARFNYTCPSCDRREPEIKLTIDHIIPISKAGTNNKENIQPLCSECNSKKWTHDIFYELKEVVIK